jgi:hypothetical protein
MFEGPGQRAHPVDSRRLLKTHRLGDGVEKPVRVAQPGQIDPINTVGERGICRASLRECASQFHGQPCLARTSNSEKSDQGVRTRDEAVKLVKFSFSANKPSEVNRRGASCMQV